MKTRREIMTAVPAAAVAATGLMTEAAAEGPILHLTKQLEEQAEALEAVGTISRNLFNWLTGSKLINLDMDGTILPNVHMVVQHPRFFRLNRIMTGPTMMVGETPVVAQTHMLKFEVPITLVASSPGTVAREPFKYLIQPAIDELAKLWGEMEANGITVYPYMPLLPVKMVDPVSFEPKFGYKSRFGAIPDPGIS